jgi:hypothetical protein
MSHDAIGGTILIYNLFQHKDKADLYCAVPADRPVPPFLTEDQWAYTRSLDTLSLPGFGVSTVNRLAEEDDFLLFQPEERPASDWWRVISLDW